MLRVDFNRAFFSVGFVIGIVATVIIFYFGSTGMVSHNTSAVAVFNNTYKYSDTSWLFILAATFAYSASFCIDWQTRFTVPLIIRSNQNSYVLSKCIATVIAGGLSVAIGAAIFICYISLSQPSILPDANAIEMEFAPQAFGDFLLKGQASIFFLSYIYVIFLQAAFFSSLGLCASSYLPDKYIAYISPFALSFVFNQIANLFQLPIWLDPVKLATVRFLGTPSSTIFLVSTSVFVSLIIICCAIFIRTAKRRIANA